MIEKISLENILFLDIETVPEEENFKLLTKKRKNFLDWKRSIKEGKSIRPKNFMTELEFGQNLEKNLGKYRI